MTSPETIQPEPPLYLEAEQYSLDEAAARYRPHPDALPRLSSNTLLIGYPGAGKSQSLMRRCWELKHDSGTLPLYLPIEPWIATAASEMAFPLHSKMTPREASVREIANVLLALGIIATLQELDDDVAYAAAAECFATPPRRRSVLSRWMSNRCKRAGAFLIMVSPCQTTTRRSGISSHSSTRSGASLTPGRKLILLLDQVERTSPLFFDAVSSLLRRGEFLAVVATRPCPTAPEQAVTPSGHEFLVHWLGSSSRTEAWREFALDIIRTQGSDARVIEIITPRSLWH